MVTIRTMELNSDGTERVNHLRRTNGSNVSHNSKRYSNYKNSGVEWLGDIPSHWKIKRLKYLADINSESLPEDTDPEREIVYLDIGGVNHLGHIGELQHTVFESAPSRARRLVREGDVIVSTVRTYLRSIAPIRNPHPNMVVSTGFAVVRPKKDFTPDYAAYALRAPFFVERVVANSKGVSFPAINESEMSTYEVPLPPETEQHAISTFLDRKTARIDELINKKNQLINLITEWRASFIAHTISKGLDSTAPLRNTGIEWLGEIPAHWKVTKVKHHSHLMNGYAFDSSSYVPEGIPVIRISEVGGSINWEKVKCVPEDLLPALSRFQVLRGDVLLAMTGATIGKNSVYSYDVQALLNQRVGIIRAKDIDQDFLRHMVSSNCFIKPIEFMCYGGAQENIGKDDIGNIATPIPPPKEQRAIAKFLDKETAKTDIFLSSLREGIDNLEEFRIAAISNAVTGKIDIREEVI